ncbi:MAG TPA: hypothetical protein VGL89_04780 [Candidatus Koribacter sp.]|jgi:hypothetical protein
MRNVISRIALFLLSLFVLTLGVSALAQQQGPPQGPPPDDQDNDQQQQGPPPQQRGRGQNVGGHWMMFQGEDAMTAAKLVRFELLSNNTMPDSDRRSRIVIMCKNGHYDRANFVPNLHMAGPNRPGFWGQPQMEVMVRVNDAHSEHGWNWEGRMLSMDKGTVRELIGAHLFRIEFLSQPGRQRPQPQIAEFSPEGLDLGAIHRACDLNPKKP